MSAPIRYRGFRVLTILLMGTLTVMAAPLAAHAADTDDWEGPAVEVVIPSAPPRPNPIPVPTPIQTPTTNVVPAPQAAAPPAGGAPKVASPAQSPAQTGTGDAPAPVPTAPTPGSSPKEGVDKATLSEQAPRPGDRVVYTGTGYSPGEQVQLVVYSTPIVIASYPVGPDGTVVAEFDIPKDLTPGAHTAEGTGWEAGHVTNVRFIIPSDAAAFGQVEHPATVLWWVLGITVAVLLLVALVWWALATRRSARMQAAMA